MARSPAVAGFFYEGEADDLSAQVSILLAAGGDGKTRPAVGVIAPHAGYAYSGAVAGAVYSRVRMPGNVVVLSPNHTGLGAPAAVSLEPAWAIPGGEVAVAVDLAGRLLRSCSGLEADEAAHAEEHGVEVQLPFLIACKPAVRIVPICLRTMAYSKCEILGNEMAEVLRDIMDDTLIVASSDMNHYDPHRVATRKDRLALDRIVNMDPRGLYSVVIDHHVSMCGFIGAVVMLVAANALGARHAEVVAYSTSGSVTGDNSSVVGYAGVLVTAGRLTPTSLSDARLGVKGIGS